MDTAQVTELGAEGSDDLEARDNVTDWCLGQFQSHYRDASITKGAIWEYLYGVMHAPDWRKKYKHDLQRNLPRLPLAEDFEAFRSAGAKLMSLHVGYETVPEHPVDCLLDGSVDNDGTADPTTDPGAYRIDSSLSWGRDDEGQTDRSVLEINPRCRLVGIPAEAEQYQVSGRSPLRWAIDGLRHKRDKRSGVTSDPNEWDGWAEEPYNLIRHLRRLVYVSVESARIIDGLPASLEPECGTEP